MLIKHSLKSLAHIFLVFVFVLCLLFVGKSQVSASYVQDDNNGTFTIDFLNNGSGLEPAGLPWRSNVTHDTLAGTLTVAAPTTNPVGFFTSVNVRPASFEAWKDIKISATSYNDPSQIQLSLYDCSGVQIPGFQNLNIPSSGIYDISSLPISYNCIKTYVKLTSNGINPVVNSLQVTWDPLPVYLSSLVCTPTKQVGEIISYQVLVSTSYADATGTVVWVPLPAVADATVTNFTSPYSQSLNATFVEASNNGQLCTTSGGCTVNGINVPQNSVYWDLGTTEAGDTQSLSFKIKSLNGTETDTKYVLQAKVDSLHANMVLSDSNPTVSGIQACETTLTSTPAPTYSKNVSGTIRIGNENYVYNGAGYTPNVTYSMRLENTFQATGRETLFNPIIVDDLTDIYNKLTTVCGVVPADFANRLTIQNGGVLDIPNKKITWNLANIAPAGVSTVTFAVNYAGCPDGTYIDNNSTTTGDNFGPLSDPEKVKIGLDITPNGMFAKGDKILGNSSISAGVDDHPAIFQPYNDVFSYELYATNRGSVTLNDVFMVDKIPAGLTFVNASLPSSVPGTIYYNITGASAPISAPFDFNSATGVFGSSWTTTAPIDMSTVKWIGFKVNCLSSSFFPSPSGSACNISGTPVPSSVTASVQVKIDSPADQCTTYDISNIADFYVYKAANTIANDNASVTTLSSPLHYTDTNEKTHVIPLVATFASNGLTFGGPTDLNVNQSGNYTITIKNNGNDSALNSILTINIPQINVNGNMTYVPITNVTGDGSSTITPSVVTVNLGTIPAGAIRTVNLIANVPVGTVDGETYTFNSTINYTDNLSCQVNPQTATRQTTVHGIPILNVYKEVEENIVDPTKDIHYKISFINSGISPTMKTYVVDAIPQDTVIKSIQTSGTDSIGNTYTCVGCPVYFAAANPNLPSTITPAQPINDTMINSYFIQGTEVNPLDLVTPQPGSGVWISPLGVNTRFLAVKVDNPGTNPYLFETNTLRNFGVTVTNDADEAGSSTAGSPAGTLIYNSAAIFSSELLQAIGNQVETTILSDPGLRLNKYSDKEVLYAGESFNWLIDYYNDSTNADTKVTITDTLPAGVSVNSIFHTWNNVAVLNGQTPSTETQIYPGNPNVTITPNLDGTTTISIKLVPDLKGANLESLEGGKFRINLTTANNLPNGQVLNNVAVGCYENAINGYCVKDNDPVLIQNPELAISKDVSNENPLKDEEVDYTLQIQNTGSHDATNITITDTLPAGLCYIGPSAILSPNTFTISEPTVTGACGQVQTLTWNNLSPSTIPGNSDIIYLKYKVKVDNTVTSGDIYTNQACTATDITENDLTNNCSNVNVQPPLPDPYILKSSSSEIVLPGDTFDYYLDYGNNTREVANNVFFIDTLPDFLGTNNEADLVIQSVVATNGETIYYNSAPTNAAPLFDITNPTADGWTTTFDEAANHIAVLVGTLPGLSGPTRVTISMKAMNTNDGANLTDNTNLPAGLVFTNKAEIRNCTIISGNYNCLDNDLTNNADTETNKTPGTDLALTKTGSIEGAFPGTIPGANISYNLKFANTGTESACAVYIEDTIPSEIDPNSITQQFNTLSLTNIAGDPVFPTDLSGNDITSSVPVTFSINGNILKWYLGGDDYSSTCLPAGSRGSFTIYGTLKTDIADSTIVKNNACVKEDSPAIEDSMNNNCDDSEVTVYRSNVVSEKTGMSCGANNICGDSDDSPEDVNLGETIKYTINYNNTGTADAQNVVLNETIPTGTCFKVGSIVPPTGTTVQYSNDSGTTWSYVPAGSQDCAVTNFRIVFTTPVPAPATFDAEITKADFDQAITGKQITNVVSTSSDTLELKYNSLPGGFSTTLTNVNNGNVNCFNSVDNPIKICTPNDLNQVRTLMNSNYILMNDLDFDVYASVNSSYVTGSGFVPIGSYGGFSGQFDGNHHVIKGLYINTTSAPVALFGGITNRVHDLYLLDVDITGRYCVGGVVGTMPMATTFVGNDYLAGAHISGALLDNVHVQGILTGADTQAWFGGMACEVTNGTIRNSSTDVVIVDQGGNYTGGLAGTLHGINAKIINSKSSGSITIGTNSSNYVGGLVGRVNSTGARIENAYSTVNISASGKSNYVGGLVGETVATSYIKDSYATGNVSGLSYVGGLVGNDQGSFTTNSFATGGVSGTGLNIGGLIGNSTNNNFYLNNAYNDTTSNPNNQCYGNLAAGNNPKCTPVSNNIPYFYGTNAQTTNWETTNYWITSASDLPRLFFEVVGYIPNGTYQTVISSTGTLTSWGKLFVSQDIKPGTNILYSIGTLSGSTCNYNLGINNVSTSGIIDLSSIPASNTNLCLKVTFSTTDNTITPVLDNWKATYFTTTKPNFTFEVVAQNANSSLSTIDNKVCISTETPEISTTDNCGTYSLNIIKSDPWITKDVNLSSVNLTQIATGTPLVFTLNYGNHGPRPAEHVLIKDNFASLLNVTNIVADQTSTGESVSCNFNNTIKLITCDSLDNPGAWTLDYNETGTITVTATIVTTATITNTLPNRTEITTTTLDTDLTNNKDNTLTVIGDFANVYTTKDSNSSIANIGKELSYTINYGNNGNIDASNFTLTDPLDPNTTFVNLTQDSGATNLNCSYDQISHKVNCGPVTLPAQESGSLTITVKVVNDLNIVINGVDICNAVVVDTDTTETSIQDNQGDVCNPARSDTTASISGIIFEEKGSLIGDSKFDTANDSPISGVEVLLCGHDLFGNYWMPDKVVYPSYYQECLTTLNLTSSPTTEIVVPARTTDQNGSYTFSGLNAGTYFVFEVQPASYVSTGSDAGYLQNLTNDDSATLSAGHGQGSVEVGTTNFDRILSITIGQSDNSIQNNFGERLAKIGNFVFMDNNSNGVFDGGDSAIPGVEVSLYLDNDQDGTPDTFVEASVTDINGEYLFDSLDPSKHYLVKVTDSFNVLAGLTNTSGTYNVDNNSQTATGFLVPDLASSSYVNLNADFGYFKPLVLGNYIWFDADHDGLQDTNETGISGVRVDLYKDTDGDSIPDTLVATTLTDGNGGYLFSNLGVDQYQIVVTIPSNYAVTTSNFGNNSSDSLDNDLDSNGVSAVIDLTTDNYNLDGGFVQTIQTPLYKLGNYVWFDTNQDGLQDSNETGVNGITVNLYSSANILVSSTVTSNDLFGNSGYYIFNNLPSGNYTVKFVLPNGYVFTSQNAGDDSLDSDSDNAGMTSAITLNSDNLTIDAGVILQNPAEEVASLGNYVWNDLDKNGLQDTNESGVPGIVVHLYDQNHNLISTTQTDIDGHYLFTNLIPGSYYITFDLGNSLWQFTNPNVGMDDALDSDVNILNGMTQVVTLVSGENNTSLDAGLILPTSTQVASLGNYVWNDLNGNGVQDASESGINGVTVILYNSNGQIVATTQTTTNSGADGYYQFTNLAPGKYTVAFIPPSNYIFTQANIGNDDTLDSDVLSYAGTVSVNLASGESNQTIDAGLAVPSSVGDFVWNDTNQNGIQDANESGVVGLLVQLIDQNGYVVATTVTDSTGKYLFTNVNPGNYQVQFNLPTNYVFSDQNMGDDNLDSDPDIQTGRTQVFAVMPGQNITNIDAGLFTITLKLEIDKSANVTTYYTGDKIIYTYVVLNSSNVRLTDIVVTDDKISNVTCEKTTLEIGESMNCSASYTATSTDMAAKNIKNITFATGKTVRGVQVTSNTDTVTINAKELPKTGADSWLKVFEFLYN